MALDAYLQLDGIQGEATEANHVGWIQVLKLSHGIAQQTSSNSPGKTTTTVANSKHDAIQVVKSVDKSTPLLHEKCCSGKPIAKATIDILKDSGDKRVVYLKYELTNVLIAGVNVSGDASEGSSDPSETVQLKYGTIKWTYSSTDASGSATGNVPAGWDLAKNAKAGG